MSVGELRPVRGAGSAPEARARPRLGYVPLGCGVLLIPWLAVLAGVAAPGWVALDVLEAIGLLATGVLALGTKPALVPVAAATAAALLLDASVDLATSQGPALLAAVTMALLAELPLAAACAVLALRAGHPQTAEGRPARRSARGSGPARRAG
ncbi:hypothetical protein [Actinacidiphila paucisporea]|uniref:Uncharacterized protein n=1 Tax=Actinacidiphila paucisporea TaxID=310782 RepID=A0A1M6XAY7_9ACTN|nr:hypothetical protein [Actinacidiphila paucisporea]SHL03117.1 hypothetical protein SAMN05216499_102364 [Actinacidiphila paucisporea]